MGYGRRESGKEKEEMGELKNFVHFVSLFISFPSP